MLNFMAAKRLEKAGKVSVSDKKQLEEHNTANLAY